MPGESATAMAALVWPPSPRLRGELATVVTAFLRPPFPPKLGGGGGAPHLPPKHPHDPAYNSCKDVHSRRRLSRRSSVAGRGRRWDRYRRGVALDDPVDHAIEQHRHLRPYGEVLAPVRPRCQQGEVVGAAKAHVRRLFMPSTYCVSTHTPSRSRNVLSSIVRTLCALRGRWRRRAHRLAQPGQVLAGSHRCWRCCRGR